MMSAYAQSILLIEGTEREYHKVCEKTCNSFEGADTNALRKALLNFYKAKKDHAKKFGYPVKRNGVWI